MINIKPYYSIFTIKRNIHRLYYDTTCLEEILFYGKEIECHIYDAASAKPFDESIFQLLPILNQLDHFIETADQLNGESLSRTEFELMQIKLHTILNHFVAFLEGHKLV
jgi:hypothetical protein